MVRLIGTTLLYSAPQLSRAGGIGPRGSRISRSVAGVSGWSLGSTSRRTGRPTLGELRLSDSKRSAYDTRITGAPWRAPQSHQDGRISKTATNACSDERCSAGMEISESLHTGRGLCLPIASLQRTEAARFGRRAGSGRSGRRSTRSASLAWAGIHFGTRGERCWPRWGSTSSPSATTCITAIFTSPTNICRRRPTASGWRKANWSTPYCRLEYCGARDQPWSSEVRNQIKQGGRGAWPAYYPLSAGSHIPKCLRNMAGTTRLELAISAVTEVGLEVTD